MLINRQGVQVVLPREIRGVELEKRLRDLREVKTPPYHKHGNMFKLEQRASLK